MEKFLPESLTDKIALAVTLLVLIPGLVIVALFAISSSRVTSRVDALRSTEQTLEYDFLIKMKSVTSYKDEGYTDTSMSAVNEGSATYSPKTSSLTINEATLTDSLKPITYSMRTTEDALYIQHPNFQTEYLATVGGDFEWVSVDRAKIESSTYNNYTDTDTLAIADYHTLLTPAVLWDEFARHSANLKAPMFATDAVAARGIDPDLNANIIAKLLETTLVGVVDDGESGLLEVRHNSLNGEISEITYKSGEFQVSDKTKNANRTSKYTLEISFSNIKLIENVKAEAPTEETTIDFEKYTYSSSNRLGNANSPLVYYHSYDQGQYTYQSGDETKTLQSLFNTFETYGTAGYIHYYNPEVDIINATTLKGAQYDLQSNHNIGVVCAMNQEIKLEYNKAVTIPRKSSESETRSFKYAPTLDRILERLTKEGVKYDKGEFKKCMSSKEAKAKADRLRLRSVADVRFTHGQGAAYIDLNGVKRGVDANDAKQFGAIVKDHLDKIEVVEESK